MFKGRMLVGIAGATVYDQIIVDGYAALKGSAEGTEGGEAAIPVGTKIPFLKYGSRIADFDTVSVNPAAGWSSEKDVDLGTYSFVRVNQAPKFNKGGNQVLDEDTPQESLDNWATEISAGSDDESTQSIWFTVTNNNNALFSVQPQIDATGKLTYTLAANANGAATVTVILHDNGGTVNGGVDTSNSQTFTITVNPVNDAPALTGSTSFFTATNTALTVNINSFVGDVDGDSLSISSHSQGSHGGVSISGTSFTYAPDFMFTGTDTFNITVSDGHGGTLTITVTVTVGAGGIVIQFP